MRKGLSVLAVVLLFLLSTTPVSAASEPTVSSLSAVLYEPTSGRVLYTKAADTKRPMASTTKLMTALLAAETLPPERMVTVSKEAVTVEGSSMGLRAGNVVSVRDLMAGLLLSSGNDAANALALATDGSIEKFAERMNAKAALLGMKNTMFVTPSGLDEGEHGSTVRDMALLGAAALKEPLLAKLCASKNATVTIDGNRITLSNHNRLLHLYEDAIGLKTGYTKKSGKCLVSAAERDGVTLIVATLNGGDYWNDHIRLYEYGFSLVESVRTTVPDLPMVPVCGGDAAAVSVTALPPTVVLMKDEKLTCEWELPPFVWAPVKAGEALGVLRYKTADRIVAQVSLTAGETVTERAAWSFGKRWRQRLEMLVAALVQ